MLVVGWKSCKLHLGGLLGRNAMQAALRPPAVTKAVSEIITHGLAVMSAVLRRASSNKGMHYMQGVAVQGGEERPGLLGYCQGNTVLVLLLSQRYLKYLDLVAMSSTLVAC